MTQRMAGCPAGQATCAQVGLVVGELPAHRGEAGAGNVDYVNSSWDSRALCSSPPHTVTLDYYVPKITPAFQGHVASTLPSPRPVCQPQGVMTGFHQLPVE